MRYQTLAVVNVPATPRRDRGELRHVPILWLSLLLTLILVAINVAAPASVNASTSGPRLPGTGSDAPGPGSYEWSSPENITASDGSYATCTEPPGGFLGYYHSHYLEATNFGFSIPSGSTINGITATIARMSSGGGSNTRDDNVYLIKGGSIAGDDKAVEADWPDMVIQEATYGGASDLWGLTWTPEDINASNFGVALCVYNASWLYYYTGYVDYMLITVTYTLPGTTTTVVTSGSPSTYGDNVTFTATVTRAAGSNTPSGTVTFKDGGTAIGTGTLSGSGGTATAILTTSSLSAGTHSTITAEYGGDGNFAGSTSSSISQVINPKSLTITASNCGKTYGDAVTFAGTEFTVSGLVNSDAVNGVTLTSSGAGATAAVAGSPYSIVPSAATGSGLANYSISYVNGSLTVSLKSLTITANNRSKTYGDAVTFAGTEFTASGLVNSDTVTGVTLTSSGAGATATVAGSPYSIVPSAATGSGLANYSIGYVDGSLTVNAKALTITASNRSKTYGDAVTFAGTEFTASGLANSDTVTSVTLTSSGSAATATVAGSPYPIVPSAATGTGLANYSISYVNGSLTVGQKSLTITASDRGKTYGDAVTFAGTEFTASGLVNSDTVTSVTLASSGASAAAAISGSPYSIAPSAAAGTGLGNYSISYVNGWLTVGLKTLTVTANDRSKTYGDTVTFAGTEFTTSGLVNSDTVTSVTLTSTGAGATATVSGSPYSIVSSAATGSGLANYSISYVNGSLTVNTKALTVTANDRSKTYGDTVTFAGTEFTTSGLVNSDTVTSVTLTSTGSGATATVAGSPYSIVPSAATGSGLANYSISYVNGSLTVGLKSLTITANDRSKTYGDAVTFAGTEFAASGLVNSDTVTSVSLTSSGASATAAVSGSPYSIVPSAATGSGLANYSISYVNGSLTVNTRALTITAQPNTKTYDGNATAAAAPVVSGLVGSDTASGLTEAYDNRNAGTSKTLSVATYTINDGSGGNNYSVTLVTDATGVITQRDLTISATGINKVYDGNTTATVALSSDALGGDAVTASYTGASFANKNVGSGKAVSVTGISISGSDAGNYNLLNTTGSTAADITLRDLTVTATGINKVYDATTTATVTLSTDAVGGDAVNASYSGASFADKNAGSGKAVSVTGVSISGADAGNYNLLNTTAATTADITQKALTVSAAGINKVYDGNTTATVALSTDALGGDTVTASYAGASFADKNAGSGKAVSVTGISISGADADNYNLLNTTAATTADITQKLLTVTADDRGKTYGTAVTFAGTEFITAGLVTGDSADSVTLTSAGADASAPIGSYPIVASDASGTGLTNYSITYVNGTMTVSAKALTITANNGNKTYGGPLSFAGTEFTVIGLEAGDSVDGVTLASTGAASGADVGAYSIIPSDAVGTGLGDYSIIYVSGTLTVSQRDLAVTATGVNKIYDGTTTATVTLSTDAVGGDAVTSSYTGASFADKNVGSGNTVSVSGISISGADAGNYNLLSTTAATAADITLKALTITALPNSKTYDGGTSAAAVPVVSGLEGSDTATGLAEAYNDRNAGTGKTLSVSAYTINDGNGGNNYSVTLVTDTTGVITQRDLTISATGINKVYDATTTATVTLSTDAVGGDAVNASYSGASFADKNAGSGKAVSVTGVSISGADAGNYNLLNTTAAATADITQKALTVSAAGINKVYDGNTTATVTLSTDALGGDTVTASYAGASFADKNAGSGKAVSVTGISISGADAGNYNLLNTTAAATADITQKALTVTANDRGKTYGTAVTFAGTEFITAGLITGDSADSVTLTSAGANAPAPIGSYPIVASDASGTGLTNYSITYVNGTMTVSAKALTITASNGNKTYGDTLTFAGTEFTVIGLEAGDSVDSVTLASTGAASGADVGAYSIIPSDAVGTGLGDYTVVYVNGTLTVSQRGLTVIATGVNKIYDGTATATVTLSTDALGGDNVTASCSGASFADKNVGSGKDVSITGISISGADAGNYNLLNTTESTAADISLRDLTVSATGVNKIYDGTAAATVTLSTDALGGDNVTASYTGATFANKNAGFGKAVSVTGISVSGADSGNYSLLNNTASAAADITQLELTVSATGVNKVYDANTSATVSLSTDALSGDAVTASYTGASFTDKNAGSGKAVSVTGISISGADAGNYYLLNTTAATTAQVTQKALTITAQTNTKAYDGDATAAAVPIVSGLAGSDTVTGLAETYDDRNAGTGKMLSVSGYTINDGNSGNNYSVTLATDSTGVVTQRDLTVTAAGVNKVYDGTATAIVTLTTDALDGDAVAASCTAATFADKNAGSGKAVSVTGISISGADAGNYNLLSTTAATAADITQRALSITADDLGKTYGNTVIFAGTEFTALGLVGADTADSVALTSAGTAASAAGGTYDIMPSAAAGSGLENYSITYVNGTLTVNKASLILTVTASPESSGAGGIVTFTATVNDPDATGTVIFKDGDTVLGTATLTNGVASFTTSDLSAGSHSVSVSYDGDPNFANGTSPSYVCDVNPASKSSWWLIVCVAAAAIGGFFLLLFVWRRRKHKKPLAASEGTSNVEVPVEVATAESADASEAAVPSATPAPPTAEEAAASGAADVAVEGGGTVELPAANEPESSQDLAEGTAATLEAIWGVVEANNPEVAGHQKRVSQLAGSVAREMGLADRQIDEIRLAAGLHDIGEVIEPAEMANEPGKTPQSDSSSISDHPKVAFDLLKSIQFEGPIAEIVVQHHERPDGSGYPYGLSGPDILLEARILAVADAVDDMMSGRAGHPALGPEEAQAELANGAGSLYDPEVVRACQAVLNGRGSEAELTRTSS